MKKKTVEKLTEKVMLFVERSKTVIEFVLLIETLLKRMIIKKTFYEVLKWVIAIIIANIP